MYLSLLLVTLSLCTGVTEAKMMKPKGVTVVDDLTGGQTCDRDRYHCAKSCEPDDPDDPTGGDLPDLPEDPKDLEQYPDYPLWGSYVEIIQTTVDPVTLYLNEMNDVSTDMKVNFDTFYKIEGSDLWEASLWFSKFKDGSGKRTNLLEETLTKRQRDKSVDPDKKFKFQDLEQSVDLSDGTGCGKYKYICGEIRKNNPNPDFALVERTPDAPRGCAKVTCKERGGDGPKTVQFDSVTPTPAELVIGKRNKVNTDVAVTFFEPNTDPTTAGEGLWQLDIWYSKDEDGDGKTTGLVTNVLSEEQGAKPVDNFNPFVFEDLETRVDLRDAVGCGKYKYICARIRKDDPEPDYELVGKRRSSSVGCAPVTCTNPDDPDSPGDPDDPDGPHDPDGPDGPGDPHDPADPGSVKPFDPADPGYPLFGYGEDPVIEVVSTSTTPVTLYLDELNDVTTDVAVAFDTDDIIQGTDLWQMSTWFSKQKDGSGRQTNLLTDVLSPRQQNKKVKPDKDLTYVELPQSVDLTDGSGCGKYKYICSELRKLNPTPNFELKDRYKLSRRGCAQVTCKARDDDTTPTVQFAAVQPTPVTVYVGESTDVTTDVDVKFKEETTDPNTAGTNLWQMDVWFSKQGDGSGKTTGLVESVLNQAQGEMPVDFDNFVMEQLPITADLTNALGCGKFKYICARVHKDSPDPDYELIGKSLAARTGCAPVNCESRPDRGEDLKLELVSTKPTPVVLYKNEQNDVTTDVTVDFDADYGVSGDNLWQMSLWFSKSPVGDGKKTNFRESTLRKSQRNKDLDIEEPLVFEGLEQSVDLTTGLGCGKFKYICAEIRKHEPEPDFSYTLFKKSSPKGCARVTCVDRKKNTPTVEFKSVQPTPVTLIIGENNDVTTDVSVEFEPETTDETVSGKNLWEMSLWFSKSKTGAGSSTGFVEKTLNTRQKKQPVSFSDFEFAELPMSVDLRKALGCGKYRFICARIRKGDPVPDYELVGPKSVVGCAPVTCEKPPEEEDEPLIIVSTSITPVTLYIGESHNVFPDVTVQFEGDEGVEGTNLWEMEIWFNKNADGSGKKTQAATSTLTQSQKDQSLVITEDLVFEGIEKSVDLTAIEGCGKFKYICAEIRKDNPNPSFEYEKKKPSSVRGCAKTSCEVRDEPEPTVKFQSTQPTGVTIYEEELNVVNTDVVVTFDEAETDPTVAGSDLWQMQLWFSKADDGKGSSIGTIESALSEEQADQPVNFVDFSFDGLEARADLTNQGCGKFQYICARVRKDKPDPGYKLIGKDPSQTTGCAPVICELGRDPTVQFESVTVTPVTVYEDTATPVTTTVSVNFVEDRTDEVSGSDLWQVNLWFSKGSDGTGSSSDAVVDVLTPEQASQPVNFRRFQFEDLEITADLTPVLQGCGKYRYICAQIRRDDPNPTYKLLGKDRSAAVGCAEVTCDKSPEPTVEFASVSTTPVTIYEEQPNPVTTTVRVTFNEANTDESVSGTGLWQVKLWFSKASDGQGSSSDAVESALTAEQGSKPVDFNNFVFEDLPITADLTSVGCGKYRFICAQIRRDDPDPSYKLLGKSLDATVGCAEVACERSQLPAVTVTSVTNTPISLTEGENNRVGTDVTINFDRSSERITGSNLWRVETWYSKDPSGAGFRTSLTEQALTPAQAGEAFGGNFQLRYRNVPANADLSSVGCGKYLHVCARIKKGEADPDYQLLDNGIDSITGCSPVECGTPTPPTPHIVPTRLTVTETEVVTGQRNVIDIDVTVNFDAAQTDDVTGENNWRIIVWLSDENTGTTGTRIAETEETITVAQKNMPLRNAGPLRFRNVEVDMDLRKPKCKVIAYVCARLKKLSPDPDYTMDPKQISGCAPCACS